MKTPVCGLCGKEIYEGPVFIGRTLIDEGVIIEHQDCREAQDILDGLANVSKFVDASRAAGAEGRAEEAEAQLKAVKSRILDDISHWMYMSDILPEADESDGG